MTTDESGGNQGGPPQKLRIVSPSRATRNRRSRKGHSWGVPERGNPACASISAKSCSPVVFDPAGLVNAELVAKPGKLVPVLGPVDASAAVPKIGIPR